jgi:tetratricopeptide (TPR) repeat protein
VAARPGASGAIFARLGLVYSRLGRSDKALEANRMAIRKSPRLLAGYRNLSEGYIENKQPDDALGVLDEALNVARADPEFFLGLSELYTRIALRFPTQREKVNAKGRTALGRVDASKLTDVAVLLKLADQFNARSSGFFRAELIGKAKAM